MQISVVILNWNAAEDTLRCVRQFADWQHVHPQLWVVDNASQDGSVAIIRQSCPQVHLIGNERNLGFAGGANRGIQAALAASAAPILLLNNDARIDESSLAQLFTTLNSDPTSGVVGPLLYAGPDRTRLIAAGSKNPVWHLNNLNHTIPTTEQAFVVDYISGSVALVRAEIFRRVGLLDEEYFFYTEVADLCERARRQGYRTLVEPRAQAIHHLDRSAPLRKTLYVYYIIRNRFCYIRKFYRGWRWLLVGFWAGYSALLSLKLRLTGQSAAARAVYLGLLDGLRGRFGGQNERVMAAITNG